MYPSPHDQLAVAQSALAADPANATLHTDLGMAYFAQDRYPEALAAFQKALTLNPAEVAAHNGIGRVYYHLGPPESSAAAYVRAIELDPHYVAGYWGLGILYYAQLGAYDKAIEVFQRGLEQNPQEVGFYGGIGHSYARSQRFAEAIQAYKTEIQLAPNAASDMNLAIVYLYLRQYAEALAAIQRAIAIAPEHAWQQRVLGFVHDRMGQAELAVVALERAVELDPDDYEARGGLARAYRAVGRMKDAEQQMTVGWALAQRADEYGRACLESVIGNQEAAVALLATALAQRQLTHGWARIDPEFVFLQDNPRYQELVQ